jgi:nitrogen fixation/metabolism regulation signal transduction histidine kinase
VKILANPVFLRAGVVFCCAAFSFLLGLIFIRLLRKNITEEAEISSEASPSLETLPMHLYNTVIQQLKQQKHELQVQSQTEQARARTAETFSQAVLSNLSSGVLVLGTNGLVKSTNAAAKAILGFASTTGMSAADIFRGAEIRSSASDPLYVGDEIAAVLHEGSNRRQVEAVYETPSGEQRFISLTISPVLATEGGLLGIACLITDLSELEQIRRAQALRGEISAEMALQLRTSLTTISGYAQQLANNYDPELAKQLAADIAEEATQLDRTLGGFLVEKGATQSVAAGSSE